MREIKALNLKYASGDDFVEALSEKSEFQSLIQTLRDKWHIDVASEIHLMDRNKKSAHRTKLLENKKFVIDIKDIQKKFQLSDQWSSFINEYVFIDFFASNTGDLFIEKRTGKEKDVTGKSAYYLRIFPETTLDDVLDIWDQVNIFIHGKKIKPKRKKPSKKAPRDKEIYKLAKLGFCIEDIQNYFRDQHRQEISFDAIIASANRFRKKNGIKEKIKLGYRKNGAEPTDLQKIAASWPEL